MDARLIAPSREAVWRISSLLHDTRIKGIEPLRELEAKKVILPSNQSDRLHDESLQYRLEHLRQE